MTARVAGVWGQTLCRETGCVGDLRAERGIPRHKRLELRRGCGGRGSAGAPAGGRSGFAGRPTKWAPAEWPAPTELAEQAPLASAKATRRASSACECETYNQSLCLKRRYIM